MFFRQLLNDDTACASYVLGCKTYPQFAVIEPHVDLVEVYISLAEAQGAPIVAVLETHVQADHVSGMADLPAPALTRICPWDREPSSSISRSRTAMSSRLGTSSFGR